MEVIQELLLPCLWGMIACVGFGLVFNIQGGGILICGLGGALGWFVYLIAQRLLGGDILPAFLAAVCIAIYSELMARVRRCPVTGYLQVERASITPCATVWLERPINLFPQCCIPLGWQHLWLWELCLLPRYCELYCRD